MASNEQELAELIQGYATGDRVRSVGLTPLEVQEIKRQLATREQSSRLIAREFGVSISAIKAIAAGKTWKEIP
jgi:hypothetical protein